MADIIKYDKCTGCTGSTGSSSDITNCKIHPVDATMYTPDIRYDAIKIALWFFDCNNNLITGEENLRNLVKEEVTFYKDGVKFLSIASSDFSFKVITQNGCQDDCFWAEEPPYSSKNIIDGCLGNINLGVNVLYIAVPMNYFSSLPNLCIKQIPDSSFYLTYPIPYTSNAINFPNITCDYLNIADGIPKATTLFQYGGCTPTLEFGVKVPCCYFFFSFIVYSENDLSGSDIILWNYIDYPITVTITTNDGIYTEQFTFADNTNLRGRRSVSGGIMTQAIDTLIVEPTTIPCSYFDTVSSQVDFNVTIWNNSVPYVFSNKVIKKFPGGNKYQSFEFYYNKETVPEEPCIPTIPGRWETSQKNVETTEYRWTTTPAEEVSEQNVIDKSFTVSYHIPTQKWIGFHSYLPNMYLHDNKTFYSWKHGVYDLWRHGVKGQYQMFYGTLYKTVIDYVINPQPLTVKVWETLKFICEAYEWDSQTEELKKLLDRFFDSMIVYTENQVSGELTITPKNNTAALNDADWMLKQITESGAAGTDWSIQATNNEGIWSVNEFRDFRENSHIQPIWNHVTNAELQGGYMDKYLNPASLYDSKDWQTIEVFRDKYLQVRLFFNIFVNGGFIHHNKIVLYFTIGENKRSIR